jgi:hypothetical protein
LVRYNLKNFYDKLALYVFEFFEILWELNVGEFYNFDCDRYIGLQLTTVPDSVIIGCEERLLFGIFVLFEDFLVLFH